MQTNLGKQKHRFISHTSKGEFSANFLKYYSPSITYKQADMIAAKCKQAGVTVYPQEIASMTNRDVDYIMAVLSLAEQSAQKGSKKGGI